MKIAIVWGGALLLAVSAQADIYTASMDQARRAVSKTEAASNQNPDGQPPSQPAAPAQPMNPELAATLQNIANLRTDLGNLDPAKSPAARGTKAPPEKIAKLALDLQTAVAGKAALRAHYQKLAQYLHAVFNGSHLTPVQFQMISDDMEQILENNGASYEATEAVLNDIKALARATK